MVNIENEIYSIIAEALRREFPGIYVTGREQTGAPETLPCAYLAQVDIFTPKKLIDSSGREKFVDITFKADVFSNLAGQQKAQCRAMMALISDMLFALYLRREADKPGSPIGSGSIYWQSARFVARTNGSLIFRK